MRNTTTTFLMLWLAGTIAGMFAGTELPLHGRLP